MSCGFYPDVREHFVDEITKAHQWALDDLTRLQKGFIRQISTKRKRYLRRRGDVQVWWSSELQCFVRDGL